MARMLPFVFCLVFSGVGPLSSAGEFRPNLGPDLPEVTVRCGDLTLLLRQASQWTPGRIDYRGIPMTTERSAYGTVFSFPEVGFIGTGHLENEPEELTSLAFLLDGKALESPRESEAGDTFKFVRESRIRSFSLRSEIELKAGRLYETATLSTRDEVPLKLLYHFMHAWSPGVSEYLAGHDSPRASGPRDEGGALLDSEEVSRKFYVNRPVDWIAVYEPDSGQFAVSRILQAPESAGNISMIWNVPGTYRKYYLKCFNNETVPAGFTGRWRMVTAFGQGDPESWRTGARELADELLRDDAPR